MQAADRAFIATLLTVLLVVVVVEGNKRSRLNRVPDVPVNKMPDSSGSDEPWWTANIPQYRMNDNRIRNVGVME